MGYSDLIRESYKNLSVGQRKVADYLISNPELVSYQTIAKISTEVGVSETTVIRLSYSLGFDSFSSMQETIQKELLHTIKKEKEDDSTSYKDEIILKEIEYLSDLKTNINENDLRKLVKKINQSDNIFCIAGRNVHPSAKWLGMSLDKIKGNCFFSEIESESYYSNLMKINDKSIVIVISFSRYSQLSYEFVSVAKKLGAYIVSITDSIVSPVGQISDIILLAKSKVIESGFNSLCSTMAICDLIIAYYIENFPKEAAERLKMLEKLYKNNENLYFE